MQAGEGRQRLRGQWRSRGGLMLAVALLACAQQPVRASSNGEAPGAASCVGDDCAQVSAKPPQPQKVYLVLVFKGVGPGEEERKVVIEDFVEGGAKVAKRLEGEVVPVFLRVGECPNWDAAIALARERACCGVNPERPNRGDRQCRCQRAAPCDVCLFLNSDRPPEMHITEDLTELGNVLPTDIPGIEDSLSKWRTQKGAFRAELCHGLENVARLAATMIHEATHLCQAITYEKATDAMGRQGSDTEDCHAYGLEYMCGFNPAIPRGKPCFIITR